jgi:hypothetical protein
MSCDLSRFVLKMLVVGICVLASAANGQHLKMVDSQERLLSDITLDGGSVSINVSGDIYERRAYPHKITYTRADGKSLLRLSRNKDGFKIFDESSNEVRWVVQIAERGVVISPEGDSVEPCLAGRTDPTTVKVKAGKEYLGQVKFYETKQALAMLNTKGEPIAGSKFDRISFAPAIAFCPSLAPLESSAIMAELLARGK